MTLCMSPPEFYGDSVNFRECSIQRTRKIDCFFEIGFWDNQLRPVKRVFYQLCRWVSGCFPTVYEVFFRVRKVKYHQHAPDAVKIENRLIRENETLERTVPTQSSACFISCVGRFQGVSQLFMKFTFELERSNITSMFRTHSKATKPDQTLDFSLISRR